MESNWGYGIVLSTLVAAPLCGIVRTALPAPAPVIAATKRFDVEVSSASQHNQRASLANPDVLAVEETLAPALAVAMDPDRIRAMVEEELSQAYPGSVRVRSSGTKYTWVWIPEIMQWVQICSSLTTLDVSLSTTVQVDVEVVTRLGRS